MANILDDILATKRREVEAARQRVPLAELERAAEGMPPARPFAAKLRVPGVVRVIAEVKKASPSASVIRPDFDPVAIATAYEAHGAAAVSVLTDESYFQGHLDHLRRVRAAVNLPLLRKEFVIDRYQLTEARAAGADAVLLIAEALPGTRLMELLADAVALGLEVLVELHDEEQLPRVLDCGARVVGVNNRDLRTFETRLERTLKLRPRIPPGIVVVGESGIRGSADIKRLAEAGVDAVLVGEMLMRRPDVGVALAELTGQGAAG